MSLSITKHEVYRYMGQDYPNLRQAIGAAESKFHSTLKSDLILSTDINLSANQIFRIAEVMLQNRSDYANLLSYECPEEDE